MLLSIISLAGGSLLTHATRSTLVRHRGGASSQRLMASMSGSQSLAATLGACDNSIKRELRGDSQSEELYPNRETRECSGHWVEVKPSALPSPFLVAYSAEMAATLGIDPAECESTAFARFFAGDLAAVPDADVRPWATPYAVSVFGQPIMSPDPFGRGRAYGDGRALSLGVVRTPAAGDWELQLKGAGTTPFSRNGDGRAVLRSSVREYLVSEAMHHMRVPTTRALCLVASSSEYIRRMWYAPGDRGRDHPPNTIVSERCAITCRAAPSFLRVGHVELHARRAARSEPGALDELEALVRHAIRREFTHIGSELPLRAQLLEVVRTFARRQAALAVAWLRVGYVQGNMNSDNCLLNGRTMDYGPFGFVERYDELWSPFTSDMERKFGFERQPLAAQVNVMTLARALVPLFDRAGGADAIDELQGIVQDEYGALLETELGEMRRAKLGLREWDDEARGTLWPQLQALMQRSAVDYTILWRQLANVRAADASAASSDGACEQLVRELTARALYKPLEQPLVDEWCKWFRAYALRLQLDDRSDDERQSEMRLTSPKYVPREWMLVEAYRAAESGDFSVLNQLASLFRTPFDEHADLEDKYFRTTPEAMREAGGVSFFS